MSEDPTAEPLSFDALAEHLRSSANALTDEWLERLRGRLGVRPGRLLPSKELRDHIPVVIRGVADYLEIPTGRPPNATVDILRTLAQLRREQGYDVQEILAEMDLLAELVFQRAAAWTARTGNLDGASAMRAATRLSAALRALTSVTAGTYREEELRQSRKVADRLSDFAATLAHELRGPLNTAGISAELLNRDDISRDPEQRQKHADRLRDRLDRIHHLVDDVRALAVAEGARAERRWIPIREVIDTVLREVAPAAQRLDVRLDVSGPDDDFDVDAVRVEIALMNLVTNSIKFSDPDKDDRWVRIRIADAESPGLRGGRRIIVQDNGRGIHPGSQNKVFQRFFRAFPEIEGTGLGLEITQRVIEQRGGRIWFESQPGTGTTFFIEIPQRLEPGDTTPGQVPR